MATKELSLERKVSPSDDYKKGKPSPNSYNKNDHILDFSWYCRESLFLSSFLCGRETKSVKDDPLYKYFMRMGYLTKGLNPTNGIPESKLTQRGIRELDMRVHTLCITEKVRVLARMNFNI